MSDTNDDIIEELKTTLLRKEMECEALKAKLAILEQQTAMTGFDSEDIELTLVGMQQRILELLRRHQIVDYSTDFLSQKKTVKNDADVDTTREQMIQTYLKKNFKTPIPDDD